MKSIRNEFSAVIIFVLLITGLFFPLTVVANSALIPLHDWSYDALDRLAAAGLVDMAEVSLKPLDRAQAAGIVVKAIQRIRGGEVKNISSSEVLEEIILKLVKELRPQLRQIAPEMFGEARHAKRCWDTFFSLNENLDYGRFSREQTYSLANSRGRDLDDGLNARLSGTGYLSIGQYVGAGLSPAWYYSRNDSELLLEEAYFDVNYSNLGVKSGRFPMWYGPGYHGALLVSDNSAPFDTVEVKNMSPWLFPGVLKYMGQCNLRFFVSRLEKDRKIPHAYLTGTRFEFYPFPWLGAGVTHTAMFGGEGNGGFDMTAMADAFTAHNSGTAKDRINHISTFDVQLIVPRFFMQYFPVSQGLKLYAELGAEDNMPGFLQFAEFGTILGAYLPGIFQLENTDLRIEFARTERVWYEHGLFHSGYTYKNDIIGHQMGGDARDLFLELSQRISEDIRLKISYDRQERFRSLTAVEKKDEIAAQLILQIKDNWELNYGYSFVNIINSRNAGGKDNRLHFLSMASKYRF